LLQELKAAGHTAAVVGEEFNDGSALAARRISIAVVFNSARIVRAGEGIIDCDPGADSP
jgi:cation transport ATPase